MVSSNPQPNEVSETSAPWITPEFSQQSGEGSPQQFITEPHPLIPATETLVAVLPQGGDPNALLLSPPPLPSESEAAEILLQDELKLQSISEKLWNRIRDALALLWWKTNQESNHS
jgi:hypothetical protein